MMQLLAKAAAAHNIGELRLAPAHGILALDAPPVFEKDVAALGFVTSLTDPRRMISACIGSDGCRSGRLPARRLAAQLAQSLPFGTRLHISGCPKGCAHPRRAPLTLVGLEEGAGLVIEGRAGDTPQQMLGKDQIESGLAQALQQA